MNNRSDSSLPSASRAGSLLPRTREQTPLVTLSGDALNELPPEIDRPRYDRSRLVPRIVHIGVGNFHRVHQSVYLHRLHQKGSGGDWGIAGIELLDNQETRAKAEIYRRQDCLYSVTELADDGSQTTYVVGSMVEYRHAPADAQGVLQRMAASSTRIISLTIAERGYNINERTGMFDLTNSLIKHDLASAPPKTAFGYIVEALRMRKEAGDGGLTVLSCDNLRSNGDTARIAILSFAGAKDPETAVWIEENVSFPNSMVDRIAPRVSEETRAAIESKAHFADGVPAICESFMQWVIEDRLVVDRPAWEEEGAELREDVHAFEAIKGRILNAGHSIISYPSLLLGYRLVHEALEDQDIRRLVGTFLERDVIPFLAGPRGVSLLDYKKTALKRFANPGIADQLLRIATDGGSRIQIFHSKTIETLFNKSKSIEREAFLPACYRRYLGGRDDFDQSYIVDEPHLSKEDWTLIESDEPGDMLRAAPFVRLNLADHAAFVRSYSHYCRILSEKGTRAALDSVELGFSASCISSTAK
jgi:mannitol 2-dehydrogenase